MAVRYLSRKRLKNGKYCWHFNPPRDAQKAGVAASKTYYDYRVAKRESLTAMAEVDAWREGRVAGTTITDKSTLNQCIASYLSTPHFESLKPSTQTAYKQGFKSISETELGARTLGALRLNVLTPQVCQEAYGRWVSQSTSKAASNTRIFSVVMSYCMSLELIHRNPMRYVKKVKHTPESIVWTKEQVQKFLDAAFTEFRWRSVALIVFMSYEWCQRPIDIRLLTWDQLDFDERKVSIKQEKRGAEVELPISETLFDLLSKQKEDFDFQDYVAPYLASDKQWKPLDRSYLGVLVKEVLAKAELPPHLAAGHLRKSGIVEMVDAEVDAAAIMSVTGHKSLQSLNPYIKPQFSTAKTALAKRKGL